MTQRGGVPIEGVEAGVTVNTVLMKAAKWTEVKWHEVTLQGNALLD